MTVEVEVVGEPGAVAPEVWSELAHGSPTDVVFTPQVWQVVWWANFGAGTPMVQVVRVDGRPVAIASLFVDGDMAFFVGAGASDYLDLVGDVADPAVLDAVLATTCETAPGLLGFQFHHVPDDSPTGSLLAEAAARRGWQVFDEGDLPAPFVGWADDDEWRVQAHRKSLRRAVNRFEREGELEVQRLRTTAEILPHLDEFFDQHVARWADRDTSPFVDERQRRFYRDLATAAPPWLRFTRVVWQDRLIAAHFGFSHRGRFLYYRPTIADDVAAWSPGAVLVRALLDEAHDEGANELDLGLGDEHYKDRYATGTRTVRTWGLYPPGA